VSAILQSANSTVVTTRTSNSTHSALIMEFGANVVFLAPEADIP
jgi:hypothetical protein